MTEAKPSPEIVRAWFDTVLNPLTDGLRNELPYLESHNLVWRFREHRSVVIRPYRELIHPSAEPNVEQFLGSNPDLFAELESYDREVEQLTKRLRTCHATLIRNETFLGFLDKYAEELARVFIAPGEEPRNFLAEYVINNIEYLSEMYSTASFWNAHSEEFLACKNLPEVKPCFEALYATADSVSELVRSLIDSLRRCRNELSFAYGVPIVSSASIR